MARTTKSKALTKKVKEAFAAVLRGCRQEAEMSQEDLVASSGLGRRHIQSLERGSSQPRLDTVLQFMRVFGDDTADMVIRTGSLVFANLPHKEPRPARSTAEVSLGEDTCPGCQAIYTLHARRVPSRARRKFKCGFCQREIATWSGTTAFSYRVQSPPKRAR